MLATLSDIQQIPGMSAYTTAYLTLVLTGADKAIKTFLKRNIEQENLTEFYSGNGRPDLPLNQYPVSAVTTVHEDPNGYWGQGSGAFPATTLLTVGTQYAIEKDNGGSLSHRGLLRRLGWGPAWWPQTYGSGKLAASRAPSWQVGWGNLKVVYTAGYTTVPADIQYACQTLVVWMAKIQPFGGRPVSSESFESYGYSIIAQLQSGGPPELGTVLQCLKAYREISW